MSHVYNRTNKSPYRLHHRRVAKTDKMRLIESVTRFRGFLENVRTFCY